MYQGSKTEMSIKELFNLAEEISKHPDVDIIISGGGEPLLHPGITDFMEKLADHPASVGIFTNGTRPRDFHFWKHFFQEKDGKEYQRFARISFNGHTPENYYKIHFNAAYMNAQYPNLNFRDKYAEARKIIIDLLALRSAKATIAIGDTVMYNQRAYITEKARHARDLRIDFIQMRPELFESSREKERALEIRSRILDVSREFENEKDFAVIYTDDERAYQQHTGQQCYAMQLVPTIVPDIEEGWTRVMPCSYAINREGKVPILGRILEGESFFQFWNDMNRKLNNENISNANIEISNSINPQIQCPQCRYFKLNHRIDDIKRKYQ